VTQESDLAHANGARRRRHFAADTVRNREDMGWLERDWAKLDEPEHDTFPLSGFARRRSRTVRAFAITMLLLFLLIAVASLVHL
jgi:hypothetical protein